MSFVLRSPNFAEQDTLPKEFVHHAMGAGGQNVSPELDWSGAPAGTKSFALKMYDPDAPTGSGWWHWVVYD
ncbi:MAG TPA: YbhB/YbcL family Raf kinase inhibitor-like protein, partial [Ramlibacter sp.]|nr:YbhB/YbcL family Raf kinase inhibitor-like protein [Ramlibacter sp.]